MTTKNGNEQFSHPIGWGQTDGKCAAYALAGEMDEDCRPVLPEGNLDRLSIDGGYCRHHYGKARAEEACAWPGCENQALDVEGHWGVFCQEHLVELRQAGACSFIGCDQPAIGLVLIDEDGDRQFFSVSAEDMANAEEGWPVCDRHCESSVNHPPANYDPAEAKKRKRREAQERRRREREARSAQERGTHRTPTASPATTSEPKKEELPEHLQRIHEALPSMTMEQLLRIKGMGKECAKMFWEEGQKRVNIAIANDATGDSTLLDYLAQALPPREQPDNADASQPTEDQTVKVSAGSGDDGDSDEEAAS
jgi:hypothetical protein